MIIPNIWENKKCSKTTKQMVFYLLLHLSSSPVHILSSSPSLTDLPSMRGSSLASAMPKMQGSIISKLRAMMAASLSKWVRVWSDDVWNTQSWSYTYNSSTFTFFTQSLVEP